MQKCKQVQGECHVDGKTASTSQGKGPGYNPSTSGGRGVQIILGQEFKTSLTNMVKPRLY